MKSSTILAASILAGMAHFAGAAGIDAGPNHEWFEAQHSLAGTWCCNVSDGHLLREDEWQLRGDHYEVRIHGAWYNIPPGALRDPRGGPNPTGQAIIWYSLTNIQGVAPTARIYCFAPGTLT